MFGLALGIQHIGEVLPPVVYALLSGLNASTVGIVALAAVQLAEKAVTDKLTRLLVLFGACAGLCYTALWYFPVLIILGGAAAGTWDTWLRQLFSKAKARWRKRMKRHQHRAAPGQVEMGGESIDLDPAAHAGAKGLQRRPLAAASSTRPETVSSNTPPSSAPLVPSSAHGEAITDMSAHSISIPAGIAIISFTLALLLALILSRTPPVTTITTSSGSVHKHVSRWYDHLWRRTRGYPSSPRVCRATWLGHLTRFPHRPCHYPSLSGTQFQLQRGSSEHLLLGEHHSLRFLAPCWAILVYSSLALHLPLGSRGSGAYSGRRPW